MVIIKNGTVIDGSGKQPFKADVLVKGRRIAAIGTFPNRRDATILDALGSYVVPGFIDIHTTSDHHLTLFSDPLQESFLTQGVTTIIGGQRGISLAPFINGTTAAVRAVSGVARVNAGWYTVKELLAAINRRGLGVNFGTLVGITALRQTFTNEIRRDLTNNEINACAKLINNALRNGAFGVSVGPLYPAQKLPPRHELERLFAMITLQHNAVLSIHLPNERNNSISALNDAISIANAFGGRTIIHNLQPFRGTEDAFAAGIARIEDAARSLNLSFEAAPFDETILPITSILPAWALDDGVKGALDALTTQTLRDRIITSLPALSGNDLVVISAPNAPYLVGKKLGEIAQNHNIDCHEAIVYLLCETKLRATIFIRSNNLDLSIQHTNHGRAIIASGAPSVPPDSPLFRYERVSNTFPRFIEISTSLKLIPIETAIRKITAIPARILGITDRGTLRETNIADIAIINNGTVRHVLVNGTVAIKEKVIQRGARGGKALARS